MQRQRKGSLPQGGSLKKTHRAIVYWAKSEGIYAERSFKFTRRVCSLTTEENEKKLNKKESRGDKVKTNDS